MKRVLLFLCAAFLVVNLSILTRAASAFSAVLSVREGDEGDAVVLNVTAGGAAEAFLLRITYDPAVFEYNRVKEETPAGSYSYTTEEDGALAVCFVAKGKDPSPAYSYRFHVIDGAEPGETAFTVSATQAVAADGSPVEDAVFTLPFTVQPPPGHTAALEVLLPETGSLSPAFSPDRFDYEMTVPFSVTSVSFSARPSEGAVCKVNRKNLGAGGSDTDFLFTVTAADKVTKTVYKVTVHREEKPAASPTPKTSSAPRPTSAPKPGKTPRPAATAPPDVTPVEVAEEPAPPPEDTADRTAGDRVPTITIINGSTAAGPLVAAMAVMTAAFLCAGPLSDWLARRKKKK